MTPVALARLVDLVVTRAISNRAGRSVLEALVAEGGDPDAIVKRDGLGAMGGSDELGPVVDRVIAAHPEVVERVRGGNPKALGALVGPVMKETKGRADGGEVQRLLREKLGL